MDTFIMSRGVKMQLITLADNTGTGFSKVFVLSPNPASFGQVQFQAGSEDNDAANYPTALTATLETKPSIDEGDWEKVDAFNFAASHAIITNLVGGPLYRFNITAITLTNAKKANLFGFTG